MSGSRSRCIVALLTGAIASVAAAQTAPTPEPTEEEIFVLPPFVVSTDKDMGYAATSTLAGTRLRTNLEDVGSSITVLTEEFIEDLGGTDSGSVLAYATNMEVSSARGNYIHASNGSFGNNDETLRMLNPAGSTRVRGLVSADNTRNYFRTNVAWDSYNVGRIDLLRGPNSILFGLGSPGGVVNASTDAANLQNDAGEVGLAFDQFGSMRGTLNYNKVISEGQLAVRVAAMSERSEFRQRFAYEDEDRQYVAATYRPPVLNGHGRTFEISVDYERGETKSNRPRYAPPVDFITPYVSGLEIKEIQLPAGTNFKTYPNGVIPGGTFALNGYQVPYANYFGGTLPLGIGTSFDGEGTRLIASPDGAQGWVVGRGGAYGVFNANGTINTNPTSSALFGANYSPRLINSLNSYATAIGHPFGSAWSRTSMTDATAFDFYNNLLDGPNKREWSDFEQLRGVLATTFFQNKLGLELSHFGEWADFGQTSMLSDNSRILVDINGFLRDGTPNPNVGRAYVQETTFGGNRMRRYDIDASRISGYFDYDFRREGKGPKWLQYVLGRQVINAAWSRDANETRTRDFQRHVFPDDLLTAVGFPGLRFNNNTRTGVQYYISDDLTGRTSLSGAGFSSVVTPILDTIGKAPITVTVFDPTWIAPDSVALNAPWVNPLGQNSTQSANPANYVGWVPKQYSLIDALSGDQADLDLATRGATMTHSRVESRILSWQGYLLDGAIVGTVGWREDTNRTRQKSSTARPDAGANLDPAIFNYGTGNTYSMRVQSRSQSVVAHLNRLPGMERLPINIALGYNHGENFNPSAGRIDKLARPLPPPAGTTDEYSILLATPDRRFSLKVARFETMILDATTGGITDEYRLQQLLGVNGGPAAYNAANGILRDAYESQTTPPSWSIDDQENISAPAWYAMETELKSRFPTFVSEWLRAGTFGPSNAATTFNIGGTNTADTLSKGYEIEFTANPTPQLRLTFNASKIDAYADNVPGDATRAIYEFLNDALWDGETLTAAGALRSNENPFDVNATMGQFFRNNIWPNYVVTLQRNGQRNTDLVQWRFNGLANYTFDEGRLKGLGIGAAYRWEGARSIGYPRYFNEFGSVTADIDRPFMGPETSRVDFILSYGRKLGKRIDWRVQLNVYNAFGENKLIPVTANPDGSHALMRIQEGRSWRVSNTFSF